MQVEVGQIYEGRVSGLTAFGAFVELPGGKTGMVHISEVAPTFVREIRDYVSENQTVKVKVLAISPEGKVSLSMKQAQATPAAPSQRQNGNAAGNRRPARGRPQTFSGGFNKSGKQQGETSFDDMLSSFLKSSNEKISDLKRSTESKSGGGYSKRGNGSL